jgi:hypothetical protein
MDQAQGKETTSIARHVNRPLVVVCASIGVGLVIHMMGAVLDPLAKDVGLSNAPTVARVLSVVGPLPVVVWQAMVVSRSWRWLTGAVSALAAFWFGRWLQGLFGLDPPYIHFILGLGLQIEGTAIGAAVAIGFIASRISRIVRSR